MLDRVRDFMQERLDLYPEEFQAFMSHFLISEAMTGGDDRRADFAYSNYYELVRSCGTLRQQPILVPDDPYYDALEVGQCYYNAFVASADQGLQYVEGFAQTKTSPFLLSHAWLEDEDGTIIDPTWAHLGLPVESPIIYFGVKFSADFILERADVTGYCAILASDWRAHTPILKRGLIFKDGIAVALKEVSDGS
jgi:hypothetical protein